MTELPEHPRARAAHARELADEVLADPSPGAPGRVMGVCVPCRIDSHSYCKGDYSDPCYCRMCARMPFPEKNQAPVMAEPPPKVPPRQPEPAMPRDMMPEIRPMIQVRARGVKFCVVAAKKPGHWIVRGIYSWRTPAQVRHEVEKFVGRLDDGIEWSFYDYFVPHYLCYGEGDLKTLRDSGIWPNGVYIANFVSQETYEHHMKRLQ